MLSTFAGRQLRPCKGCDDTQLLQVDGLVYEVGAHGAQISGFRVPHMKKSGRELKEKLCAKKFYTEGNVEIKREEKYKIA